MKIARPERRQLVTLVILDPGLTMGRLPEREVAVTLNQAALPGHLLARRLARPLVPRGRVRGLPPALLMEPAREGQHDKRRLRTVERQGGSRKCTHRERQRDQKLLGGRPRSHTLTCRRLTIVGLVVVPLRSRRVRNPVGLGRPTLSQANGL